MDDIPNHHAGPSTCQLHEKYALRVNSMWFGFKLLTAGLALAFGVIGTILVDTRGNSEQFSRDAMKRDHELGTRIEALVEDVRKDNTNIIRVLNTISINQKRTMEAASLPYMAPEWVRHYDRDD